MRKLTNVLGKIKTGAKAFFRNIRDFFKKKITDIKNWNKKRKDKKRKRKQLKKNSKKGKKFEEQEFEKFSKKYDSAEKQITIKTKDGTKIRVDAIGKDKQQEK